MSQICLHTQGLSTHPCPGMRRLPYLPPISGGQENMTSSSNNLRVSVMQDELDLDCEVWWSKSQPATKALQKFGDPSSSAGSPQLTTVIDGSLLTLSIDASSCAIKLFLTPSDYTDFFPPSYPLCLMGYSLSTEYEAASSLFTVISKPWFMAFQFEKLLMASSPYNSSFRITAQHNNDLSWEDN